MITIYWCDKQISILHWKLLILFETSLCFVFSCLYFYYCSGRKAAVSKSGCSQSRRYVFFCWFFFFNYNLLLLTLLLLFALKIIYYFILPLFIIIYILFLFWLDHFLSKIWWRWSLLLCFFIINIFGLSYYFEITQLLCDYCACGGSLIEQYFKDINRLDHKVFIILNGWYNYLKFYLWSIQWVFH